VLDVREQDEVISTIRTQHLPRGLLELNIEALVPDRTTSLAVYCAGGKPQLIGGRDPAAAGIFRRHQPDWRVSGMEAIGRAGESGSPLSSEERNDTARHLAPRSG